MAKSLELEQHKARAKARASVCAGVRDMLNLAEAYTPRAGTDETPGRYLEAFEFYVSGYKQDPALLLKTFEDGAKEYNEIVLVRDIPIYSLCEHHLAPFWGRAHVAYLPMGKIVGLSKIPRVCEAFMRRLQVQERLTTQIANCLKDNLKPRGVAVILECRHMCMESRGVQVPGAVTTTSAMLGHFRDDPAARAEVLTLLQSRTTP